MYRGFFFEKLKYPPNLKSINYFWSIPKRLGHY